METVAIVGVGLIGGSFALALREAGFRGRILGVSSPRTIQQALETGVVDEGATLEQAASRADLLFLAQPIRQILTTVTALAPHLNDRALVTDAGSTKAEICARARASLPAGQFLGGHPMSGKETRGVAGAEAGLFQGRTWVLTRDADNSRTREFASWLERIGAGILLLTPEQHDAVVAVTSHVPQLASTALSLLTHRRATGEALRAAGPGLIDMTRLAMSSHEIWADILATNSSLPEALDAYIAILSEIRNRLPDLAREFEEAAALARRLRRA